MKTPALLLPFLALSTLAPAATIVYDFNAASTTTVKLTADVTGADAADYNVSDFSGPGNAGVSATTDTAFLRSTDTGSILADALADLDYFTFTITPTVAGNFRLDSFVLDFGATNSAASAPTFTSHIVVQSSVLGFGTGFGTLPVSPSSKSTGMTGGSDPSYVSSTVTTTGQVFSSASPLTIQIRHYDDRTDSNAIIRLDNLVLNASPVPEPSALLLSALGLLPLLRRKR